MFTVQTNIQRRSLTLIHGQRLEFSERNENWQIQWTPIFILFLHNLQNICTTVKLNECLLQWVYNFSFWITTTSVKFEPLTSNSSVCVCEKDRLLSPFQDLGTWMEWIANGTPSLFFWYSSAFHISLAKRKLPGWPVRQSN